jgi:hypothetical protein
MILYIIAIVTILLKLFHIILHNQPWRGHPKDKLSFLTNNWVPQWRVSIPVDQRSHEHLEAPDIHQPAPISSKKFPLNRHCHKIHRKYSQMSLNPKS